MKLNTLIFAILFTFGMGNSLADTPKTQEQLIQEQIKKLTDENKEKTYQELSNKIDERIKSQITTYKDPLDKTIDMLKFFCGIILTMFAGLITLNYFKLKNEVESKVKEEVESKVKAEVESKVKEAVESKVKDEIKIRVDAAEEKIDFTLDNKLKAEISLIDKLITLEQAKRQLLLTVEDIEEPSMLHEVSMQEEKDIKKFLKQITDLRDELKRNSITSDIADTIYNQEIAGVAYHYIKNYDKAIEHFEIILKDDKENDRIHLRLGNSFAGKRDYINAIEEYKLVDRKSDDKYAIQVCISRGDAYKAMVNYKKAIEVFSEVNQKRAVYKDRYYWESLYGEATSQVAIGKYKTAEDLYTQISDSTDKQFKHPVWLYVSMGDCCRKSNKHEDSKKWYNKAFEICDLGNKKAVGEIRYKLGRLYVDMQKYADANTEFAKIICQSNNNYFVFNNNRLLLFWGYSLKQTSRKEAGAGEDKITYALNDLRTKVQEVQKSPNFDKEEYNYSLCYEYYDYAMGLAMIEEADEANAYLDKLITDYKFNFVKDWAKSANYSDFINIQSNEKFLKIVGQLNE